MKTRLFVLCLGVLLLLGCERKPAQEDVAELPADRDAVTLQPPIIDMQSLEIKQTIGPKRQLADGLTVVTISFSVKPNKCRSSCSNYDVSWLFFPDVPALNNAVLSGLFSTAELSKGNFSSAEQLIKLFTKQGALFISESMEYRQRWSTELKLVHEEGRAGVHVLRIDDARYTGGAHGSFQSQYINWDAARAKTLSLSDIILPEQEQSFWSEVEQKYEDWLRDLDNPESIMEGWPFERTNNFALLAKHLRVQYQAYDLGPYSEGMPAFDLPYARLQSSIQPQYVND
ncbi:MAG: RsiV family protein [Moraxellaceae bacterium]|nr:RsiV family protein [Moraxellaceae bacterium]